ncbi:hypothetical protein BKA08_001737 [Nocardioides marinisabuli]|uniref:DUF4232 domain-containing protein n=1 Tax=Nocardioides marinisabuli TaxID=419476 RepID=A0A7Y9F0X5_9ACTN|nr:hypothetical protein [Nocardioides marinisabuli]NYD57499.1 hypothetical protein [Nocardioides marinisabuli]
MSTMTRGPLAPAVYWRRRLVVMLVALLILFGGARLLGLGGGDEAADEQLVQSSAETEVGDEGESQPSSTLPTSDAAATSGDGAGTTGGKGGAKAKKAKKAKATALPEPVGTCLPSDVKVQPVIDSAVAGREVAITLELSTRDAVACTWEVSPGDLTMKITSGPDEIWTSRQCPKAVPTQEVVLRSSGTTTVEVAWSSRRSDDSCSKLTDWALPGFYHVTAAALAGEPRDVQFELVAPVAPTITASPEPQPDADEKKKDKKDRD